MQFWFFDALSNSTTARDLSTVQEKNPTVHPFGPSRFALKVTHNNLFRYTLDLRTPGPTNFSSDMKHFEVTGNPNPPNAPWDGNIYLHFSSNVAFFT